MVLRRAAFLSSILLLAALAGCITDPTPTPEDPPQDWTDTTADVWLVRTIGCGFCHGSAPWATTTALYADGHVVSFSYTPHSHSAEQTDPLYDPPARQTDASGHVRTAATAAPDHDALVPVAQILASYDVWDAKDKPIHIETYRLGVLSEGDWDAVRSHLSAAIEEAGDPGAPRYDCEDCAGVRVQVLGQPPMDVTLHRSEHPDHGNVEEGDPWDRIERQMQVLHEWVGAAS